MAGVSFKPSRKGFETALVAVSVCGGVIATLLAIVLLISGTTTIQTKSGGSHILLKDLALVSFDGIIPNNETSEFLVHLHWFVGAFAWEYPNAPDGLPTAGITTIGPRLSSNIADSFRDIATKINLPRDDWSCPGYGPYVKPCDNLFFEAWRSWAVQGGSAIDGWMAWILLVLAIPLTLMTIAQEWMIRKRPYWMRCRCIILKSWCPCPKGTKEEIEKLDDFTWDKVRVSYWALAACYFLLPTLHELLSRVFFLQTLTYIERRLPKGWSMNARRGTTAPTLFWCAVGFSSLSALCMVVKWRLSRRPKGWMEEQSLGQLGDSSPENSDTARGEASGRYTD